MGHKKRHKYTSPEPEIKETTRFEIPGWFLRIAIAIASLTICFVLYGNTLHGEFVYDDLFFADRQDLHQPSSLLRVWTEPYIPQAAETGGGFYRPMWVATLALNFIFFGSNTFSFHFVNILLYAAILFVLFFTIKRLFNNDILAGVSTLFFAFLPIHTEVVANIKSRDELLSVFFALLAWLTFLSVKHISKGIKDWRLWLSALLFFFALLSKESVVLVPAIFFIVSFLEKSKIYELAKATIPFLIAGVIYLPLRMIALGEYAFFENKTSFVLNQLADASLFTRISTSFYLLFLYVAKTFIPFNLSASYDYAVIPTLFSPFSHPFAILGIFVSLGLGVLIFWRKIDLPVKIGAIFFVISYLVVSKVFFAKGAIFGERLIFLGSIGLSIIAGWVIYQIFKRNQYFAGIILGTILVIYATIIIPRNLVWTEPEKFFEQMVRDAPNSVQARSSLARGYFNSGKLRDSYDQAQQGYKIYQNHAPLLNILGKLEYIREDYKLANEYFDRALTFNSNNFENHQFYCLSLVKLGKYSDCMNYIQKPFNETPNDLKLRFIMAVSLYKAGETKNALLDKYNWAKELNREAREKILKQF